MTKMTTTLAALATVIGLLGTPSVFAQSQTPLPKQEATPKAEKMEGMMKGSQGGSMEGSDMEGMGDMKGMMGMMSEMTKMMGNCNQMMEAMNTKMDQKTPAAVEPKNNKG